MSLTLCATVLSVLYMLTPGHCHAPAANTEVCLTVPFSVDDCYAASINQPISPKAAKVDCLQRLLWFYEPNLNLTVSDLKYFSSLSKAGVKVGHPYPKTGYRVRQEYRRLSHTERNRLHVAFQKLYTKGILEKYALLHREAIGIHYHGASFLPWNRVFLAKFEDELRLEDNTISLPYLDLTYDYNMANGVNSILWSEGLLGNGYGDVVTGPFAGWKTLRGSLWRNYGSHQKGRLISSETIHKILSKCRTDDISFPTKIPGDKNEMEFILEYHLNGIHNWIGGDMSNMDTSAFDPAHFMVHAFADMKWEEFRIRQKSVCGVNPETDYPTRTGGAGHGPNDLMYGFDGYKNVEGMKNYWIDSWYNYAKGPKCPKCGTKYMYCDKKKNECTSHSRRKDYNPGQYYKTKPVGKPEPFEPHTTFIPKLTASEYLPSPLSDCRTRASAKRDAKKAVSRRPAPSYFGNTKPKHKKSLPQPNVKTLYAANAFPKYDTNKSPLSNLRAKHIDLTKRMNQYTQLIKAQAGNLPPKSPAPVKPTVPAHH